MNPNLRIRIAMGLIVAVVGCGGRGSGTLPVQNTSRGVVGVWLRRPSQAGHTPAWERAGTVKAGDSAELDLGSLEPGENLRVQVDAGPMQTFSLQTKPAGGCARGSGHTVKVGESRRAELAQG